MMSLIEPDVNSAELLGGFPGLSGLEDGLLARKRLHLEELDHSDEPVRFVMPIDLFNMTSAYFRGLFGESVKKFGSEEAFLKHYVFENCNDELLESIIDGIKSVLMEMKN